MPHVITIPCVVKGKKNHTIFDQERDFSYLVDEYMGMEARNLFEEIIEGYKDQLKEVLGDDYESIADGYHNALVDTANSLKEELDKPKLSRKNIETIWRNLHSNL